MNTSLGYGAGGRLGIGGTDSVSTPILVESLQHVFIKKVAVNSGGKHCLALTGNASASIYLLHSFDYTYLFKLKIPETVTPGAKEKTENLVMATGSIMIVRN